MAFDKKQLLLVEAYTDRQKWTYDTSDAIATVIAAGYITDGESANPFGIRVGDEVEVRIWADVTTKASLTSRSTHKVSVASTVTNTALDGGSTLSATTTGVIGYAAGSGGTVTQATSKATGVTLSRPNGQITMNAAALNLDTTVSFVLTNTLIAAGDRLVLSHDSGGTFGKYLLNARAGAGSATIDVTNISAGSLSEAIVIGFTLIKGATA